MASMVESVMAKKDWKNKLSDKSITDKWRKEFLEQGATERVVDMAFRILQYYARFKPSQEGEDYEDDDLGDMNWFITTSFDHENIIDSYKSCKCECLVCQEREYELESYKDGELEDTEKEEVERLMKIKCHCLKLFANKRMEFLTKFLKEYNNLVTPDQAKTFKALIDKLPKNVYHPHTDNLTVDVIHPSLNCYIDGVTDVKRKKEEEEEVFFQWLPSNVEEDADGDLKFTSYINNLPESNKELYSSIASILKNFVQPFRDMQTSLKEENVVEQTFDLKKFQVIVKVQELHLTPEAPAFNEGTWHLEGTNAERILATGIYYYEMENIEDSFLSFRVLLSNPNEIPYPQSCMRHLINHYGIEEAKPTEDYDRRVTRTMNLGQIQTKQGHALVFPNIFQHRVSTIKLKDRTKPGSRKILVFWLIDPSKPITSTADVKQQQLPPEEAQQFVELLMLHRKQYVAEENDVAGRTWSLCEH